MTLQHIIGSQPYNSSILPPNMKFFHIGLAHPTQKGLKLWRIVRWALCILRLGPCTFYQISPENSLAHTQFQGEWSWLQGTESLARKRLEREKYSLYPIIRSPKVGGSRVGKFLDSMPASMLPSPATCPWALWYSSCDPKMAAAARIGPCSETEEDKAPPLSLSFQNEENFPKSHFLQTSLHISLARFVSHAHGRTRGMEIAALP